MDEGTSGNLVQGNFIGTDAAGKAGLGNFAGVALFLTSGNTVGGTSAAARNVISGNNYGVFIFQSNANLVQGNFIGLAANGGTALGNSSHGVVVTRGSANNSIGGTAGGAGNRIAHNGGDGVLVGSDDRDDNIGFLRGQRQRHPRQLHLQTPARASTRRYKASHRTMRTIMTTDQTIC